MKSLKLAIIAAAASFAFAGAASADNQATCEEAASVFGGPSDAISSVCACIVEGGEAAGVIDDMLSAMESQDESMLTAEMIEIRDSCIPS